jgi:hypothetical protein
LAGQVIFGGCASFTVTVKLHTAELPAPSVAIKATVVCPFGNAEPLGKPLVLVIVKLQFSVTTGA